MEFLDLSDEDHPDWLPNRRHTRRDLTQKATSMNPKSYRILAKLVSTRVRCPVCHEEVYSRAGIHPQCAVRQCDPPKVKNKGQKTPTQAESVPVTTAPAGAEAVVDLPTPEIITAPGLTSV